MNHTKKTLLAALAVAVGSFAVPAQAAFISGTVNFGGLAAQPICSTDPSPCTTATDLTGVDFTPDGDNATALGSGDFSAFTGFGGPLAEFRDISFATPTQDVWLGEGFTFSGISIDSIFYSTTLYGFVIRGTTTSTNIALEPTPSYLEYSSQPNGFVDVAWSATHTVPVPTPGVLALFGIGLAGLGLVRRRAA